MRAAARFDLRQAEGVAEVADMDTREFPAAVRAALDALARGGYAGYPVGGCVRDVLRGCDPHDWDLTTDALPEETKACFPENRVIETGMRHGTVTVLFEDMPLEITTFRVDGKYADHRRPNEVTFTDSLREDLARRDFTVNAMAFDEKGRVIDPFGGREDLAARRIRCVGEPHARFEEDGLRILRALRFAAVLDFSLDPPTAAAVHTDRGLLTYISAERIREELCKLLCGPGAGRILREYTDVIGSILPEILPSVGFDQKNPHHSYDVWEHTLHAVDASIPRLEVRLAVLLHDLGKPMAFTEDAHGGHFYGHAKLSAASAEEIMRRLHFDRTTSETVYELILRHDTVFRRDPKQLRRLLRQTSSDFVWMMLSVHRADVAAQAETHRASRLANADAVESLLRTILAEGECFTLRDLALHGDDLIRLGYSPGPELGRTLNALLDAVIDGRAENDKDALIAYLKH